MTKLFGVGIDLGTTNSVVATALMQGSKLATPVTAIERDLDLGPRGRFRSGRDDLLPSFVAYIENRSNKYEPNVGDFAKKLSITQPFAVACSIKSQMGQPAIKIPGWKPEYPDQTPEEVSAQILRKMRLGLSEQLGINITNAVITVPASFNLAQSQATLKAADLAGFQVKNKDGSFREDVLLSEPEAVVYDVLNQLQNGNIHFDLDLSTPKNILVYDIGGGTLDITLHTIQRNAENEDAFDIRPLATNRYSTMAGDTFDNVLAEWMYKKYVEEWKREDMEGAKRIQRDKDIAKMQMLRYAEELKVDVGKRYQSRKSLGNPLSKSEEFDYGGEMPNGYSCESYMELGEFEEILTPLMGEEFSYDSYKNLSGNENTENIIYPVLNVLEKASKKLETPDVKVDAVILNGGMSRLYMIEERLERFFGFRMVKVSDPDKSVAQGAAVYHYNLCSGNKDMLKVHEDFVQGQMDLEEELFTESPGAARRSQIHTLGYVQNETLYIGLKGGAVKELIKSGEELPYESPLIEGFSVAPNLEHIYIPIKQKGKRPNEFQTIARGSITLNKRLYRETPLAISFLLRRNQVLTLNAWIGGERIGNTNIDFGDVEYRTKTGKKITPPEGTKLNVANALSEFLQTAEKLKNVKGDKKRRVVVAQLQNCKKSLRHCGNPEEFADGMLKLIRDRHFPELILHILPVMRRFSIYWQPEQRERLSYLCLKLLDNELHGWSATGLEVSRNIEAIQTIGIMAVHGDCVKLTKLRDKPRYRDPLLRVFGMSGIEFEWIRQNFLDQKRKRMSTQASLLAICLFMRNWRANISNEDLNGIAREVFEYVDRYYPNPLNLTIIAIGLICKPEGQNNVEAALLRKAEAELDRIGQYPLADAKAVAVARQLLSGAQLAEAEEKYLLGLFEDKTDDEDLL